jgi:hypothetical protein
MTRAKANLDLLLADGGVITPERFEKLLAESGLSAAYLRKQLLARNHPLDPLVEGVRQDTLENLTRCLSVLGEVYERQPKEARGKVLDARRHLEFALRRDPESEFRKTVLLHLRIWLENPPIYGTWLALQRQKPPSKSPGGL